MMAELFEQRHQLLLLEMRHHTEEGVGLFPRKRPHPIHQRSSLGCDIEFAGATLLVGNLLDNKAGAPHLMEQPRHRGTVPQHEMRQFAPRDFGLFFAPEPDKKRPNEHRRPGWPTLTHGNVEVLSKVGNHYVRGPQIGALLWRRPISASLSPSVRAVAEIAPTFLFWRREGRRRRLLRSPSEALPYLANALRAGIS